eukprot:323670-Amphidinium_carterae.1
MRSVRFGDLVRIAGVQCADYGGLSLVVGESSCLTVEEPPEEAAGIIAAPAPVELCALGDVKPCAKADFAVQVVVRKRMH